MTEQLLRIEEAARIVGVGRTQAYGLVNSGEWPVIRVGRSLRMNHADLEHWIERSRAQHTQMFVIGSDVEEQPVEWLWQGYIPRAALTVVDGDPATGKSSLTCDLAARVTSTLRMPSGPPLPRPAGVVVLSCEDDTSRVIVPRLRQAGADLTRIVLADQQRPLVLDDAGIRWLADAIRRVDAVLVTIDPLNGHLPAHNSNRDADVRRVLAPLSNLAARTGVAIVMVRHLNKSGGDGQSALYRGGGSIAIIGTARAGFLFAKPSNGDAAERVLACTKMNLATTPPAQRLELHVERTAQHPTLRWLGECSYTADQLVGAASSGGPERKRERAARLLEQMLTAGPVPKEDLVARAAAEGISEPTLKKAKQALGIADRKVGFGTTSYQEWFVPPYTPPLIHLEETDEETQHPASIPDHPRDSGTNEQAERVSGARA